VKVRFFAAMRDAVGAPETQLDLEGGATPEDVWRRLAADHPALQARRSGVAAAVNRRYAAFDTALEDGDEVVFVPPVSGG
jgi:molybdopterin synthase sulfur carrier subunit